MKNVEKGNIKHLVVLIYDIAIFEIIIYPLFDLVLCKFITNSEFIYSTHKYIIQPMLFSGILGATLCIIDKKKEEK